MAKALRIVGKNVLDTSGRSLVLAGVTKERSLLYYENPAGWVDEKPEVYDMIKASGANEVKLVINRWQWEQNAARYLPALDNVIDMATSRGLYVFLEWHEWYNAETGAYYMTPPDKVNIITELNGWKTFVTTMATRYKDNPMVVGISPLNEPPKTSYWTGYTSEQAKATWRNNMLEIIDIIHGVEPGYIIEATKLGTMNLSDFTPFPRPNIKYIEHRYYGWDIGWQTYANAYMNATTEAELEAAYPQMRALYQQTLLNFRDTYNVPVGNSETSMSKLVDGGVVVNNSLRQFDDQMRMMIENGIHHNYFSCDRDFTDTWEDGGNYWALLNTSNPELLNIAGETWYNAMQTYHPPTPKPLISSLPAIFIGIGTILIGI